ncbi:hypothetical protein K435DRAFT_805095 [Dendrothele bispora CBS 962.96]|uniref:Uncharacterized protein n=1 Tax=Dendrothele bispora (strain CBS 962.96) TaxID=1314807 RepID=A0A4S8LCM1_DENBC|nr:hypothetical protein K435DRAFT_805095 [Dendrothele bispora CBS 962.96]
MAKTKKKKLNRKSKFFLDSDPMYSNAILVRLVFQSLLEKLKQRQKTLVSHNDVDMSKVEDPEHILSLSQTPDSMLVLVCFVGNVPLVVEVIFGGLTAIDISSM